MKVYQKVCFAVFVILCGFSSTLSAQFPVLSQTTPGYGSVDVDVNTTIKFHFDAPIQVDSLMAMVENPTDLKNVILPIPYDAVEITGFRLSNENKTIELDVIQEDDTEYYWILFDLIFEGNGSLASNHVLYYSTRSPENLKFLTGSLNIQSNFMNGKSIPIHDSPLKKLLPELFKSSPNGPESGETSSVFNPTKALVLLSDKNLDEIEETDIEEGEVDPEIVKAVGSSNMHGRFSVPVLAQTSLLYLYALLMDDYSFAYGFYDGNNDGLPDPINTNESTDLSNMSVPMFGFSSHGGNPIASNAALASVVNMALTKYNDVRLLRMIGSEFLSSSGFKNTISSTPMFTGKSETWSFTFHSDSGEKGFHILTDGNMMIPFDIEEGEFEVDLSSYNSLPTEPINSDVLAQKINELGLDSFFENLPDDAMIVAQYNGTTLESGVEGIEVGENTPYWDVFVGASYLDGDEYAFDEMHVLFNAESGEHIQTVSTSIVDNVHELPLGFVLEQNYPNPFNPSTFIKFQLPYSASVTLSVYDALGRLVDVLASGNMASGSYALQWDAENQPSGLYFYKLEYEGSAEVKKMLLIK
jgi:hypothetical protein